MPELSCDLVGSRSPFSVDVDGRTTVMKLKRLIKTENSSQIACDAAELELYLARKEGT